MQKRLNEILQELEKDIHAIKIGFDPNRFVDGMEYIDEFDILGINYFKAKEHIFYLLKDLLLMPSKSYDVTFKGIEYKFFYPTTKDEKLSMIKQAATVSRLVIDECLRQWEEGEDVWWLVTAFASGIDPLDMQIEIIKEQVVNRVDEKGKKITALPIDMDNYQIKQEMEYDQPDQTLDL